MALKPIKTPCIGLCRMDIGSPYCIGCGRTSSEIGSWLSYSDEQRDEVMDVCYKRLEDLFDEMP